MPLEEVWERFTKSEMAILSWRSQEQYWQMKMRMGDRPRRKQKVDKKAAQQLAKAREGSRLDYEDELVDNLPDKYFNNEGELDLRNVTGPEAIAYLNAKSQALNLPLFPMIRGASRGVV